MIGFETASEALEVHHILFQTILQKSALIYCNGLFNYVLLNSYGSSSDMSAVNNELDRVHEVALCDKICENTPAFLWRGLEEDHQNLNQDCWSPCRNLNLRPVEYET